RVTSDGPLVPYRGVVPASPSSELVVEVPTTSTGSYAEALQRTFVFAEDALSRLAERDPAVARVVERHPNYAPALISDPFAALVPSISAQQINLRFAAVI